MKNKVFILVAIVLIAAIAGGVYLLQQRQSLSSKAVPATTLSFSPANSSPNVGDEFDVNVNVSTGTNSIVGIDLAISYDTALVEVVDITNGTFFTNAQSLGKDLGTSTGVAKLTLYLPTGSTAQTGSGIIAVLRVKMLSAGSAVLAFTSDTVVGGIGENGQNVLSGSTPTTLNISSGGSGPTSTPTPTQAAQGQPSPTQAAQATATPTVASGQGQSLVSISPTRSASSGGGANSTTTTTTSKSASSASGSASQLPNTATTNETLFGLALGMLLIVGSMILKFRN